MYVSFGARYLVQRVLGYCPSPNITRAVLAWYTAFCFPAQAGSYDYQQLTERYHYSVMTHRTSGECMLCLGLMGTVGTALTGIGKGRVSPGVN